VRDSARSSFTFSYEARAGNRKSLLKIQNNILEIVTTSNTNHSSIHFLATAMSGLLATLNRETWSCIIDALQEIRGKFADGSIFRSLAVAGLQR
jgi:hypothetical protein